MDRSDWQGVYEECYPRVFRALVAVGARPEEAEDALHDAFREGIARNSHVDRPEGWLFVVAVRRWRRHRVRNAIFRPLSLLAHAPEDERVDGELMEEVRRLPMRQRQVVVARYLVGLSQEETAHALGIARGTVGALVSQALARLRERLEER